MQQTQFSPRNLVACLLGSKTNKFDYLSKIFNTQLILDINYEVVLSQCWYGKMRDLAYLADYICKLRVD
jgi:hypothetical protein